MLNKNNYLNVITNRFFIKPPNDEYHNMKLMESVAAVGLKYQELL